MNDGKFGARSTFLTQYGWVQRGDVGRYMNADAALSPEQRTWLAPPADRVHRAVNREGKCSCMLREGPCGQPRPLRTVSLYEPGVGLHSDFIIDIEPCRACGDRGTQRNEEYP